jgi:hypothetical protein
MSCCQSLFHRQSKCSLRREAHAEEYGFHNHSRAMSTSSTVSRCSSTGSHTKATSYDPLSLHPPLCLNASPIISEDDEIYAEVPRQEDRQYLRPPQTASNDSRSSSEYSSEGEVYFNQDKRRRTYVYDQQVQWPLKDWQPVPPGLASMSEDEITAHAATRTNATSQRRPPREDMSDLDMFVKRGAWKRRGIVFEPTSDIDYEQTQHFELPE